MESLNTPLVMNWFTAVSKTGLTCSQRTSVVMISSFGTIKDTNFSLLIHTTYATRQLFHFTQEPQNTVIYKNNLIINCTAQSDPSPTITWYRGDPPALVPDVHVVNGSLVIPTVVEGVDASRGGIPYHCRATTAQFGTVRS